MNQNEIFDIAKENSDQLIVARQSRDDFVLNRNQYDEFKITTNVPWTVIVHSPAGYEWGYHGSGPADLALNILETVLRELGYTGAREDGYKGRCFTLARKYHQQFKQSTIATMPREGGIIPFEIVMLFMEDKIKNDNRKY